MINLEEFNLNDDIEWSSYIEIYKIYLTDVSGKDDDFEEIKSYIKSDEYKAQILKVCNRDYNKFHVCRIIKDGICIGFCDYICYLDEDGKCLIGNFFLYPEYRNQGYGTEVFNIIEKALIKCGGRYIDITPAKKAVAFYLRKGFYKTEDISLENGENAYRKMLI